MCPLVVAGTLNAVITGGTVSVPPPPPPPLQLVAVMSVMALMPAETLPAASFAQAQSVTLPLVETVKLVGAFAAQPAAVAAGAVEDSVTR